MHHLYFKNMDLKEIIYTLEKENPNSMDLGNAVRNLVWKMKKTQSNEVNDENLKGQINIFGEVKQ